MSGLPDHPVSDFDSPWKEAIEAFFEPFIGLFFPAVHALIDWHRQPEFLDAELQRITGDSTIGRRYADRLVKVWNRTGAEVWLLLHIEVQGRADPDFGLRMYQYWYRIFDRHGDVEIISLGLLTNEPAGGPAREFRRERDGMGLRFRFRVHGLPDWDEAELAARAADNPFAVVALAQLAAHRRGSAPERKLRKREIIALLYRYRYDRDDAIKLLRFIDWLIRLPKPLELALRQELTELEEQTKMSYVTSWEQFARAEGLALGLARGRHEGRQEGREEGRQEGRLEGRQEGREEGRQEGRQEGEARALLRLLEARFGPLAAEVIGRVQSAPVAQLEVWLTRILTAERIEQVFG